MGFILFRVIGHIHDRVERIPQDPKLHRLHQKHGPTCKYRCSHSIVLAVLNFGCGHFELMQI